MVDAKRAGPATLVRTGGQERWGHLPPEGQGDDPGSNTAGQVFLVDCGRAVLQRAAAVGVGAANLTALLLTHLHSDHITDLSDVITNRWVTTFVPTPLPIIGPPGTAAVVEATLAALGPDISYRIAHHADITEPPSVQVHEHTDGPVWDQNGVQIRVSPIDHRPVEPTIGFRIEHDGASVVLAGDSVPCTSLDELAAGAGALVHNVIRKDVVQQVPQQRLKDILDDHSSVEEAGATAARAGVGTLILTHYVPPIAPGQRTTGPRWPHLPSTGRSNSATTCTGWRCRRRHDGCASGRRRR